MKPKHSTARVAAEALHEGVSQHILGMLLMARTLKEELKDSHLVQAEKAAELEKLIQQADIEIRKVIRQLDGNAPR